jgi:hypothetical protein
MTIKYAVRDSHGRYVTSLRDISYGDDESAVWVWRTDPDQPPMAFDRDDAEAFVAYLHADSDVSGYIIEEV